MSLLTSFLWLRQQGLLSSCHARPSCYSGSSCCTDSRAHRLGNSDAWLHCHGVRNLPRPGIEPVSPALAGGFLTPRPPGGSPAMFIFSQELCLEFQACISSCPLDPPPWYPTVVSDWLIQIKHSFLPPQPVLPVAFHLCESDTFCWKVKGLWPLPTHEPALKFTPQPLLNLCSLHPHYHLPGSSPYPPWPAFLKNPPWSPCIRSCLWPLPSWHCSQNDPSTLSTWSGQFPS